MNENTPLSEARAWVNSQAHKGVNCPCCNQLVKIYRRKLSSSIAYTLVELVNHTLRARPYDGWVHVADVDFPHGPAFVASQYSILRFWGLLEKSPHRQGDWRVTQAGFMFVRGEVRVPRYVYVQNNQCLDIQEDDPIELTDIRSALGDQFDLDELMRPVNIQGAA